jgi:hypothetical protein
MPRLPSIFRAALRGHAAIRKSHPETYDISQNIQPELIPQVSFFNDWQRSE